MKLPKLAIENHQFTVIMMILLGLFGLSAFLTMPRSEDPQFKLPITIISVVFPGVNPTDLEKLIADPIEEAVNELEDIKKYETRIEDGLVVMRIEFETGADPDEKEDEVNDKVNQIRGELPEGLLSLEVVQASPSDVNILQIALVSDSASYRELGKYAERLKKNLERVGGVKSVEALAYPEPEVRVSLDMEKAAALNISLQQIIDAIQSENANIPGGSIDVGGKKFNVETSGDYESLEDIARTIVRSARGRIIYLNDIASITFDHEDETYYARLNGRRAVFVTVVQKEETNIFRVMKSIETQVAMFRKQLPEHMQLEYAFKQTDSVASRLNGFFFSLLQGIVLVGMVVVFSLGLRASLMVMLAIPLSIIIAIGFVDQLGFGLQQMTIVGLVIALGLLVDNAIVVTENVSRFLRQGYSLKEAAIQGTSQIGWPIVSSTVTTVLAFLPIVTMQSTSGSFIRSMPVTVIFTLLASLLVSLTLTPYLASKFFTAGKTGRDSILKRWLDQLIERRYRRALLLALRRPYLVLSITLLVFLGSLALFPLVGVSFFPKAEKPQFIINIDLPEGNSLDKTNRLARHVETLLSTRPEIELFTTNIGHGNPRIYYNIAPKKNKSTHAQLFVKLKSEYAAVTEKLVNQLRGELRDLPGAKIQVKEFEQGPPVDAPISIKVIGEDLQVLKKLAFEVEDIIASTEGTINIENPLHTAKTNLHVNINRSKASIYGVPTIEVDRTVRAAIAGLAVSNFKDIEGEEHSIVIRLPHRHDPTLGDFHRIHVASFSGAQIPLTQLASIELKAGPSQIHHFDLERNIKVTADVAGGYEVENITRQIISRLENYRWPQGYRYYVGGQLESRQEAFGGLIIAILIAMIAILGVLVLQFRSYIQPLIVFSAIPVAVVGSILALLFTGYTFSFTAFVGLTSLVGIVVNNSIILVDYTNRLRQEGINMISAIQEAAETRLTPIILTTATTVCGLLPLTLGGGTMWAPMGWTLIGGLIVSTFLTLLVVPVLYKLFTRESPAEGESRSS